MNENERMSDIRKRALDSISRNELYVKLLLGLCGLAEILGLGAVFWFIDWSDATHRLIFVATMLVWTTLGFMIAAIAVRNRVGEQRVLQAVDQLHESMLEGKEDELA